MNDMALTFDNVSAGYYKRQVLHNITLEFQPGHVSALIGPNGAGKSTLIKAASGVLPLSQGRVRVNGHDISKLNHANRAKLISVIPQARNLPPAFTVFEVVQMGRTAYTGWFGQFSHTDADIIEYSMKRTDTFSLADRRIGELSGGEAQRVLLARAISQQASVMLLDEPTTHLDIQYQVNLLDMIVKLAREDHLAVVLAIHDLNLVSRYADRVVLLVEGRVQAAGLPADVLNPEILTQGYHLEMNVIQMEGSNHPVILPR